MGRNHNNRRRNRRNKPEARHIPTTPVASFRNPPPNQNTNEYSEREGESHEPSHDWGKTMGGSFSALHSGSWIQNVVVAGIFVLITPAVGLLMNKPKVIVWGAAAGLIITILLLASLVSRQIDKPASSPEPKPDEGPTKEFKIQERAYLVFKGITGYPPSVGKRFSVKAIFTNAGKTNANSVGGGYMMSQQAPTVIPDYNRMLEMARTTPRRLTTGAGQEFSMNVDALTNYVPTEEIMRKVNSGELVLRIWGVTLYTDIFGETHRTFFSSDYLPTV
jgi:hypothetical protein